MIGRCNSAAARGTRQLGTLNQYGFRAGACRLFTDRAIKVVKPGGNILVNGAPHYVKKIMQGKRGKGGGFVKATLKNLLTTSTFEKTFTSDESVEVAPLTKHAAQYSWLEGSDFVFMDSNSYEEVRVPIADVDAASYISDSVDVTLLKYEDRVLNVELPTHALYEVLDISTSGSAKLSTALGTKIIVPAFVEVGQTIKVNTSTGVFVERA